ncbi:MAG: hypothetical protein H0V44_08810 [Planctomycetes bacterium]|nr:hypothetical protein [Planctomycetota bacterium]
MITTAERTRPTRKKQHLRQQLLFLYLSHPSPAADTIAWSRFDGASTEEHGSGDGEQPPYPSVLAAMRDGWRVIQVAQQAPPALGLEHRTAYLAYEFVLERLVETTHA